MHIFLDVGPILEFQCLKLHKNYINLAWYLHKSEQNPVGIRELHLTLVQVGPQPLDSYKARD